MGFVQRTVATDGSASPLPGYGRGMTDDPRRIVDDLEAKIMDEEGVSEAAEDSPAGVAEAANQDVPGMEPTD